VIPSHVCEHSYLPAGSLRTLSCACMHVSMRSFSDFFSSIGNGFSSAPMRSLTFDSFVCVLHCGVFLSLGYHGHPSWYVLRWVIVRSALCLVISAFGLFVLVDVVPPSSPPLLKKKAFPFARCLMCMTPAVVGENGAGKSTLLKALQGDLVSPSPGSSLCR
jgi:hypothetical protein